jgi:hypothetical protein
MHNLQVLQRPDPFPPFTPDPHCPDRLARPALAIDLPRRWRVIPADRSDFARSGLPTAVDQREQHAALEATPTALRGSEIYKRRGISICHCGFGPNHGHLGQLLTYLADIEGAKTVVSIAETIQADHRAAIDWLNSNTTEEFSFFAIEIEL